MGSSISWLAVKGKTREFVLQELGLIPSGRMHDFGTTPFTSRALPSGWFLLVLKGCEHKFIKPNSLASLSKNCQVIACSIEEHVMVSSAEQWADGARIWRAEHIGENGPIHLTAEGALPADFQSMADAQKKLQSDDGGEKSEVDHYFDIPLRAAQNIVGFKHDETDFGDNSFEVLESIR
jgi:hypothetical protein